MRRIFGIVAALAISPALASQPNIELLKDYNHVGLQIGSGTTNEAWLEDETNVSVYTLSYAKSWQENWLTRFEYTGLFFHPDGYNIRVDRFLASAGYRWSLKDDLDFYARYGLGYIRSTAKEERTGRKLESDDHLLQAATLGFNYQLYEKWFIKLEGMYNYSDILEEGHGTLAIDYQFSHRWRLGGYYRYRDSNAGNHSNEVGLSGYWTF
ncbi:outer membrane beta-barrel protein [Vibrio sp. SM6]|uniref:Outer membrane beta-barrel protein n=1 Tax=Vibrio agarilyticus TaxID=2726741 RepID=A0A7X8TQ52_9VIBR|nr:outer membrane beta-barrel protein [Vibrio agarilyticus]NLS12689.1 outer membrane beta-barrel protein [Vibrio agarilyticus]